MMDNTNINAMIVHQVEDDTAGLNTLKALRESESKLRLLTQHTNSVIWTLTSDLTILYISPAVEKMHGYTVKEMIGKKLDLLVTPESMRVVRNGIKQISKVDPDIRSIIPPVKTEIEGIHKSGKKFWTEAVVTPVVNEAGKLVNFVGVTHDISEKREMETRLQQALNIFENIQSGIYIYHLEDPNDDRTLRMVGANPASHKLTGVPVKEVIGKTLDENFPGLREKGIPQKYVKVIKTGKPISLEDLYYKDQRVIAGGFSFSAFPLPDNHLGVSFENITKRKIAEEELKTRNSELNNFVYKVSHDLRAPLSSIKGLIHLAKLENGEDEYLKRIGSSVEKLDEFIRNVLSHSRNLNTRTTTELIDFEQMISQCFKELDYLENSGKIKKRISLSTKKFYSDPVRVFEIFRNTISNAIKYQDLEKNDPQVSIKIIVTSQVAIIEIKDNGIGIEKFHLHRIFEMFYRASEQSEGSGIGLYILDQAVKKLNGTVTIKSKYRKGTTIMITLPNNGDKD
jgi:PAS domain S-box-containing protein